MKNEQLAAIYTCRKRTAEIFLELKKCVHMCTNNTHIFTIYSIECQLTNQLICGGKKSISVVYMNNSNVSRFKASDFFSFICC